MEPQLLRLFKRREKLKKKKKKKVYQLGAVEKERVMDEGEEEVFLGGKTLRCPKVLGELGR